MARAIKKSPRDGEPCEHPGCLSHQSHPCEGCGRIGGFPVRPKIKVTFYAHGPASGTVSVDVHEGADFSIKTSGVLIVHDQRTTGRRKVVVRKAYGVGCWITAEVIAGVLDKNVQGDQ